MMASRYPAQVDSSLNLPSVRDNFTPVTGSAVNILKDAIVNVETELGVKPSGIYGTVRARLDAFDRSGGIAKGIVEKNGNYTLTSTDKGYVILFVVTTTVTATLPTLSELTDGDAFSISNATGNNITIDGGGMTIYGSGSTEVINDSESRIYCFSAGAVSGTPKWVRI